MAWRDARYRSHQGAQDWLFLSMGCERADLGQVRLPGSRLQQDQGPAEHTETLVCTENLSSGVVVVKSAKDGVRFDASDSLNLASDRRIFIQ